MRIEICANRCKHISSAVQMSDVLSHKSMLLGDNFSPSEMELAPPHILLTLFALLLTLLTVFKINVRTAPTANTAYLEVYMHVHVHKYIKYCFVVETHEILEGIRSNYYTLLCSKKMSTKEANYFWSPCLKSSWTAHCLHAFSSALGYIYFSHKIFQFYSCIWQL